MTIATQSNKVIGLGNGSNTSWPYRFLIPSQSVVQVLYTNVAGVITTLTTSQYTISGINNPNGGTVTYPLSGPAIPAGSTLTIIRVMPLQQLTDLIDQGGYYPAVVEGMGDNLEMQIQQIANELINTIRFPPVDPNSNAVLPAAAARAGLFFAFDGNGNPTMLPGNLLSGSLSNYSITAAGATQAAINSERFSHTLNVKSDFGAVGNGIADDTAAFVAAIAASTGKRLFVPGGTYNVTGFSIPDGAKVLMFGTGSGSVIRKIANGAMISLGALSELHHLYLDGNGASFTGIGVSISTGGLDFNSWRRIVNCEIRDTASYGVEFTADSAGYYSTIANCLIVPYLNFTVAAVKMPTLGTAETNGNRHLVNVISGSNVLCDFGDCDNAQVVACDGGLPLFGAFSQKISISGSRFVAVGVANLTFRGIGHAIAGSTFNIGGSIIFDAGLQNFHFGISNSIGAGIPIVDNSLGIAGGDNQIWYNPIAYTPTWTGSVANPAIVNGQLLGRYWRRGSLVRVRIVLVIGGSTTLGTGYWIFSPPKAIANADVGITVAHDSATNTDYIGVTEAAFSAWAPAGIVAVRDNTAAPFGAAAPFAWTAGSYLVLNVEYEV